MAATVLPARPASSKRASAVAHVVAVVGITLVFGWALFSVNNVLLNMARGGWNKILLIQGSFDPTLDAQSLYRSASRTTAIGSGGLLPELLDPGKIKQFDGRIVQQAHQERRLPLPDGFFKGLPPSS